MLTNYLTETMEKILSTVDNSTLGKCTACIHEVYSYIFLTDKEDWSDVTCECRSLASRWDELCLFLHLPMGTSDAIKEKYPNKELSCLSEALKLWILRKYKTEKYGLPTWKMLLEAVGKIDENLFKTLAKEHQGMKYLIL